MKRFAEKVATNYTTILQAEVGDVKRSSRLCLFNFTFTKEKVASMKIITLLIIVVVVFSALGLCLITYGNTTSEERNMNYGISIMIDKMSYSIDETIKMTLKIFNYIEEDVVFHFNNSQRYDFIVEDKEGNEVWRWSDGRMFAQMLGEATLGPTNIEIIYTVKYKGKLSPGYYKITGILVAQDRLMSGSIIIEVK